MNNITSVKFLSALMIMIIATFISCSEDSPTDPKEQGPTTLSTKTITNTGGSIITDNIEIEIPSGAFSSSQEIKILESTEDNMFGADAFSDFYTLDGLPVEINEPINIKIKYAGTLSDSCFIAFGEKNIASSLNAEIISYQLISARDSAGYLIGTLPPLRNATLEKSLGNSSINAEKLSINLGAIAGYVSYQSEQGHFIINTPSSVITQAYDLADYLETAYSKFKEIGFSYSRRNKWPIKVTVKRLKSTVYGYSYNSVWGNNYGSLEFNFDKMDDKENLKVTAGHEFFHLVQSLYDSRNSFSKAKFQSTHLWLDEASSVWSESFFSSSSNYLSPIFTDNVFDVFNGAKIGNDKSKAGEYGYGMSSLIKYVTKEYGDDKLVDIYNSIYNGKSAFKSLSETLPIDVGFSWHSFLRNLLSFKIYSGDTFRPGLLVSYSTGEHQKFIIKSAADSLASYKSSLSDLSATIFSIDNQFSTMATNSILEFTCKNWNFQLYKINSNKSEFLKSGKDILTISNFKKLTDDGYKIIAVLYNDDYDSPFENSKDYEMEIRVKLPPKNIIAVSFHFAFTGTYQTDNGTSTYYNTFWNDAYADNTTTQMNGNTVSVLENYIDNYSNTEVTTELIVDDIDNPKNIVSIKCTETLIQSAGTSKTVRSAEAKNIPLIKVFDNGTREFLYEGNITQNLQSLTHLETSSWTGEIKVIEELLSYQSEGRIDIMIYYEQ